MARRLGDTRRHPRAVEFLSRGKGKSKQNMPAVASGRMTLGEKSMRRHFGLQISFRLGGSSRPCVNVTRSSSHLGAPFCRERTLQGRARRPCSHGSPPAALWPHGKRQSCGGVRGRVSGGWKLILRNSRGENVERQAIASLLCAAALVTPIASASAVPPPATCSRWWRHAPAPNRKDMPMTSRNDDAESLEPRLVAGRMVGGVKAHGGQKRAAREDPGCEVTTLGEREPAG